MADKSVYKKLKGTSIFGSNALYRSDDHLLSCNSNFFSEEYFRFYYRDIQSIITRKTVHGKIFNVCLIAALALFLTPAFLLPGGWIVFFSVLASVVFILLVINLIKGPTAICHIQTLVQTARLQSIKRIKGAEKAILELKPLIENRQGVLSKDRILGAKTGAAHDSSAVETGWDKAHEEGKYHQALYALLALSSAFIIMDIFYPGILLALLSGMINLAIGALLVVSLKKQSGTDIFNSIKTLTWTVAGYLGFRYIFSYSMYMFVSMTNPKIAYLQWEVFKKTASISPSEYSWIMAFYTLFLFYTIGVGITGLILIAIFKKEYREREADLNNTDVREENHE